MPGSIDESDQFTVPKTLLDGASATESVASCPRQAGQTHFRASKES